MTNNAHLLLGFGNTNLNLGIFKNNKFVSRFIISNTNLEKYAFNSWKKLIENEVGKISEFEKISYLSVKHSFEKNIVDFFKQLKHQNVFALKTDKHLNYAKNIKPPRDTGADIICNVAKGLEKNKNILIFDFGSAITATYASQSKGIEGVLIFPGIEAITKAVLAITPAFPKKFDLAYNKINYELETDKAINSGILLAIDGIIDKYIAQAKAQFEVEIIWSTGNGISFLNAFKRKFTSYKSNLTLEGLQYLSDLSEK